MVEQFHLAARTSKPEACVAAWCVALWLTLHPCHTITVILPHDDRPSFAGPHSASSRHHLAFAVSTITISIAQTGCPMAASSSGRPRSSQLLPGNPAVYSGAAALLALLVVLRRRVTDSNGSKASGKGSKRSKGVSHTPLTTPQVEAAQRELYRVLPDGSRELLVPTGSSGRIAKVIIRPVKESTYAQHRKDFISHTNDGFSISKQNKAAGPASPSASAISRTIQSPATVSAAGQSANQVAKKVAVNKEFLRQLRAILKIIFPR